MSSVGPAHNLRVLGSGETTVILNQCYGTDQSVWKYFTPHLVDQYRVILFDNMGVGTTNPDCFDFKRYASIEGYALDLIAILEEFSVGKCIYVGHSMTSMVGVYASILRPDLFHKLVMLCASPRATNTEGYEGGYNQEEVDQVYRAIELNNESFQLGFAPLQIGADQVSPFLQEYCRTLFNMRPDISMCVFRTFSTLDMRHLLPHVTVPCHIIQSSQDTMIPKGMAEYIHQNLGGKSIVELIPIEGHLPQLSMPEVTNPVLLRHIHHDIADA
uniref:KAI2d2 n=1 Tax=Phelipanche aegyptiaca TaxID=99112 RepID=A0A2U8XQH0_9LAMI|nr:KAI2d2 [Phelipanche aegyptiaca]